MKNDKWVKQWVMPSSSGGNYIVSEDKDGNFACSCIGWTLRIKRTCPDCGSVLTKADKTDDTYRCWSCRKTVQPDSTRVDCRHIEEVKGGGGKSVSDAMLDLLAGR